ncbi:MAG: hypothetical protein NVS3B10_28170 [Polyangiales bacterium]
MVDDPRRPPAPPGPDGLDDPDAPPSAEEIAESARLRDALESPASPHPDAALARALRGALGPPPSLDDDAHRALLDRALDAALTPPSAEELSASARLRDELDDPGSTDADVRLARSLRHAVAARPLEAAAHRAILDRALGARARSTPSPLVWIGGAFAAAASIAFAVLSVDARHDSAPSMTPASTSASLGASLVHARSVDGLFAEPFPLDQPTSARIDRIAVARARDLRANHFTRWGVR